jgi:hypothetical protein
MVSYIAFAIGPIPSGPVGMWISRPSYPILSLDFLLLSWFSCECREKGTHLSTAETIAAVPAPKTSSNDPFFSASTKSPIVIFLSDTLRLEGRPGIDLPSICPRHRFNTLHVSSTRL